MDIRLFQKSVIKPLKDGKRETITDGRSTETKIVTESI
jgi:hypothetical protein